MRISPPMGVSVMASKPSKGSWRTQKRGFTTVQGFSAANSESGGIGARGLSSWDEAGSSETGYSMTEKKYNQLSCRSARTTVRFGYLRVEHLFACIAELQQHSSRPNLKGGPTKVTLGITKKKLDPRSERQT